MVSSLPGKDIFEKIKKLKHMQFGKCVLERSFGEVSYELLMLTADRESDTALLELLGRWRKENEMWYSSQFKVTTERTARWYRDKLINVPDRLLFIIRAQGEYIGHAGLAKFDLDMKKCDIDNVLRGEKKFPGIIKDALVGIMLWGREELGIRSYALKVQARNEKAVRLYEKMGFVVVRRIPQIQVNGKDGPEWVDGPEELSSKADRFSLEMELNDAATAAL